jgi:hypothetical protein
MPLNNLPRVAVSWQDQNLLETTAVRAPRVLVIGTAGKGVGDSAFVATTGSIAKSEFGSDGNLIRGMWEAEKTGAREIVLYRIGSTAATLTGVGDSTGAGGYTITTIEQDADAGADYAVYYLDSADRLIITRVSDGLIVFDNSDAYPVDEYTEITVSGYRAASGGPDIGTVSAGVALEDVTATGTTFTAGTDGLSLSRMELYQELYVAYKNLLQEDFDVVVPMDVYLDDYNVIAQGSYIGAVTPVIPGGQTYPTAGAYTPGTDVDSLGRVYIEEYEGDYYFWWWLGASGASFTSAAIYPTGVGSASATLKIDGTALTADDFHEVNFGYQLARFLYEYSTDIVSATGVIGVLPPSSTSFRDKARWLGKEPTWTLNTQNNTYSITSPANNGSGLLGNKFMVGRNDWRSGAFGGGMILTDTEFMDGTEQIDTNEAPIDLGKYISVVVDTPLLRNNWYPNGYRASFAASYAGFYVNMDPASSPTNKRVSQAISLVYKFKLGDLDKLSGAGYVMMRVKPQGLVVADAPTASTPQSDYRRLSTVRIVKAIVDGVRLAVDKYLGEGMSSATRAAMQNDVEKVLLAGKKGGYLQDYKEFEIIQTPSMNAAGRAEINLRLVPAYELRVVDVSVSVTKAG